MTLRTGRRTEVEKNLRKLRGSIKGAIHDIKLIRLQQKIILMGAKLVACAPCMCCSPALCLLAGLVAQ